MYYKGIIDTHSHYDDERFSQNLDEILRCQAENGVESIITCGSDMATSYRSIEIAEAYDFVYAAVGVHPHAAGDVSGSWLLEIEQLAAHPKAVAIGELGLDYYYPEPRRDIQQNVFRAQLELAGKLNMPVQIHDRDAHGDIMDIVNEYHPAGCLHRYSGSTEQAREYVKLGLYLGIGGALTYKNSKKERAVVAEIPLEHLILETDCPYLAPEQFRGRTSTSDMLWVVANMMAEIKGGVTPQQVVDITRKNAKRAFNIT